MSVYCALHGYNNPDCDCNPWSNPSPFVSTDRNKSRKTGPLPPTHTLVLGLDFEEARALVFVLTMFGYDAQMRIDAEFRAPLQKYPRTMVVSVSTDCPVDRLFALTTFLLA